MIIIIAIIIVIIIINDNNDKNEAIKINYNKRQKYFILLNFKCFKILNYLKTF